MLLILFLTSIYTMAPGQKSVFVGNSKLLRCRPFEYILTYLILVPFNLSEEQIVGILSHAGQVVKFRLMTNPDTGKPKGFGFADYADADSAASAVRNLNDYEVNGRKIRVDWPHNNEKDSVPSNYDQAASVDAGQSAAASALPHLPPGVDLPPNLKCTDAISQTLNALPAQQLIDVLAQMKTLAISEPARATELLKQAPQLSYAIFQALILLNLVDPKVLAQVVEQATRPVQPAGIAPQPPAPQYPGYATAPIPPQQMMPPRPAQQYAPSAIPQQPPQPQPTPQMSQEEMLRQVLAMDQRTIDSLPPLERSQVMQLRQQMGVR